MERVDEQRFFREIIFALLGPILGGPQISICARAKRGRERKKERERGGVGEEGGEGDVVEAKSYPVSC